MVKENDFFLSKQECRNKEQKQIWSNYDFGTGKSLSEALIHAATKPQYGKRLFIELQVQYMKTTVVFVLTIQNNLCTQHVLSLQFSWTELVIQ